MADEKQKPPQNNIDYEQAIFNEGLASRGYTGPQIDLPPPVPASEWLEKETDDPELLKLLLEKEANLNAKANVEQAPPESPRVFDQRDGVFRPRNDRELKQAIWKRRKELDGDT